MAHLKDLKKIIAEAAESLGYECVAVDIKGGNSRAVLRVYIDAPDGVGHEDCERVSRWIAEYMDQCEEKGSPWFKDKYFVEVSSPGLERPLFSVEHYRRFAGRQALLSLRDGRKISGLIESVCGEEKLAVVIGVEGTNVAVPFEEIKHANLVFVLEKGEKKTASKQPKKNKK